MHFFFQVVQLNWTQITENSQQHETASKASVPYDNTTLSKARRAFAKYDMDSNCVLSLNEIVQALKQEVIFVFAERQRNIFPLLA